MGIAVANHKLYVSSGYELYERENGKDHSYKVVHSLADLTTNIHRAVGGIRGLTAIPNKSGGESLLFMWCPNEKSRGLIFRLDPKAGGGFDRVQEANMAELLSQFLGKPVHYFLGGYNEFYAFQHPQNKSTNFLVGMEGYIGKNNRVNFNGYYKGGVYAVRDADGNYQLYEIETGKKAQDLVATRCYVQSPFPKDNTLYFAGFDPNSFRSTDKAWIYTLSYKSRSQSVNGKKAKKKRKRT